MESCCGTVSEIDSAVITVWAAFLIGVTTSLGHCIGMCGPLVSTFSLAQGKTDPQRLGAFSRVPLGSEPWQESGQAELS